MTEYDDDDRACLKGMVESAWVILGMVKAYSYTMEELLERRDMVHHTMTMARTLPSGELEDDLRRATEAVWSELQRRCGTT